MPDVFQKSEVPTGFFSSSRHSKSGSGHHTPGHHTPPATLQSKIAHLHLYKETTERLELIRSERHTVIIEDEPFASGGVCEAFRIWFMKADGEKGPMQVAKRYKFKDGKQGFREDHVNWFWTSILVEPFNTLLSKQTSDMPSVKFMPCTRLMELNGEWYSIEDFLEGKFMKFNNIFGDVERLPMPGEESTYYDLAAAFSHFSFFYSGNEYVVLDIQGVDCSYTDPAVVSRTASKYGYTDTGLNGLQSFFKKHTCNAMCAKLGLKAVSHKCLPPPTRPKAEVKSSRTKTRSLPNQLVKGLPSSLSAVDVSSLQVLHGAAQVGTLPAASALTAVLWDTTGMLAWPNVLTSTPYYWGTIAS